MFKELEPEKIETLTNLLKQKYDEFTPEVISSIQSLGKGITFKDFVAYLLYMEDHSELLEGADDYIESNYVAVCACIFPYDELIDGFSKIDSYSMLPDFINFKKEHGLEADYKVDYDKIVIECIERNKKYEFNGLYSKIYQYTSDETKKKVYNYFLENAQELKIYDSYVDGFIDILKYGHKNNLDISKLTSMISPAVLIKLSITDEDEVIQSIYEDLDSDGKNLITNFKELKDSDEITPEIFEKVFEATIEHEYRLEIVKYAVKKGYIPPIETFQEAYYVDDEVKSILSNNNLVYYLMTKPGFHSKYSDDLIEQALTSPEMKTAFMVLKEYDTGCFGYSELIRELGDLLNRENITKYFDENGMKFEFMQEVVKRNSNKGLFSLDDKFLLFTLEQGVKTSPKEDYVYYDFLYTLTKLYSTRYSFFYGSDIRNVVKDKNGFYEILANPNQLIALLKENARNPEVIFSLMKINAINEEIAKDIISPNKMTSLKLIKEILDNKIFDNDLFTTLYTSEQFYNEKGLNKDELIKHLIENAKTDVLLSLSDKYVSKQQQEFFKVFLPMFENEEKRKDNNYDFIISTIINPNEINEYIINNQPTKKLIDKFFELGYLKCIKGYENFLDDKQRVIYEVYKSIDDDELKNVYNDFIGTSIKDIYLGNIKEEVIRAIPDLLNQIKLSNSSEIAGRYINIAKLILQSASKESKDPIKQFRKIEKIFLTRELSHMDKIFKSFQLLYPHEKLIETIREKKMQISPTLYKYATSPEETILGKEALRLYGDCTYAVEMVMYADLLKTTIASNDKTFIDYIDGIEKGNQIFSRLMNNETNIVSLTGEEKYILNTYVYHLEKLYNRTHRSNPIKLTNDLDKSLSLLMPLYKSVDISLIPDQIIKNNYYTYLGISTMQELKEIMNQAKLDANSKGYEYAKRKMIIEKGDLIKGIGDISYFDVIIQNGSVSKEFLGGDIGSDLTPFDTDLSIVPETKDSNHESTSSLESNSYGPIFFVIKDAINKYNCTRKENETAVIEETSETFRNIEIFRTLGNTHYGIRTGFPTTQVDYIYCTDPHDFRIDKIGLVLAKNGIYIPVVDKEGNLLFTPENYEHLRQKMAGLSYYGLDRFDVAPTVQNDYILTLASQIGENIIETRKIKQQLEEKLRIGFAESGLLMKTQIDGDLQPGTVELIDTGSTGRGTNQIGDGDFDFMVRLDKIINRDSLKVAGVTEKVCAALGISRQSGDLRKAKIPIDDKEVELDISYVNKSDKITYTTDMSLTDRLETIRKQDPEKHLMVLANIVLAKKLLKLGECYKPRHAGENPQGGLGGVGTENWILQNGGSLEEAATEFLIAAGVMKIETTETGKQIVIDETAQKEYNEFKNTYSVWDFGQNQMAEKRYRDFPHDNFVDNNMNSTGYGNMVKALQVYMMELHPEIKFIPKPVSEEDRQKQEERENKIRGLLQGLKQETYTEQPSLVEEKGK